MSYIIKCHVIQFPFETSNIVENSISVAIVADEHTQTSQAHRSNNGRQIERERGKRGKLRYYYAHTHSTSNVQDLCQSNSSLWYE